jgi:uncharacterized NAD(P)/FAD-binding protein YdhS
MEDEVLDVAPAGRGAQLILREGEPLQADRVVLATGNRPPRDLTPLDPVRDHPAYSPNPWRGWYDRRLDAREDALLVGTGLTMIDVYLTLHAAGWHGTISAVSRNGLLPLSHFRGSDYPQFPPDDVETLSLHDLVAVMEDHCARLRADGRNPAIVVDKLRPFTQRIWRNLSVAEKREFFRRYCTRWNVTRHRIPPTVAGQLEAARAEDRLRILKGRLQEARGDGDRIRVTIDPGNGQPPHEFAVGLLVNCTGPCESLSEAPEPLFRNLFARGLIRADELDMGIDVTPDFAVVNRQGMPSNCLFAIGPPLRGTLWETTAVPELRAQARQVAEVLLRDEPPPQHDWVQETPENLVEYYI